MSLWWVLRARAVCICQKGPDIVPCLQYGHVRPSFVYIPLPSSPLSSRYQDVRGCAVRTCFVPWYVVVVFGRGVSATGTHPRTHALARKAYQDPSLTVAKKKPWNACPSESKQNGNKKKRKKKKPTLSIGSHWNRAYLIAPERPYRS